MSSNSRIEWTESTWSPVTGCSRVSAGCQNCYAEQMSARLANIGQAKYQNITKLHATKRNKAGRPLSLPQWNNKIRTHPDVLDEPLHRRKPTTYFVCSMSDLFHKDVPFEFIDKVFAVMALCPQHTFQILTKRPERMAEYLTDAEAVKRVGRAACNIGNQHDSFGDFIPEVMPGHARSAFKAWPLPNVWLGTSVENQEAWRERYLHLTRCPAAVRFISAEPLLGPLEMEPELTVDRMIHWVITGGESGPNARPMHPQWVRDTRDQCVAAGVPFFFKQWGAWAPWRWQGGMTRPGDLFMDPDGTYVRIKHGGAIPASLPPDRRPMRKVGKKSAGRELDGREWNEMPERVGVAGVNP